MVHLKSNPAVSVYYCNLQDFLGLMLGSKIKIVEVQEIKKALWHEVAK
jgi:general stress protein 26